LFALTVGGVAGLIAQTFSINRLGEEESYGNFLAIEGLEATRAIARRDYFNLVNGNYGLTTVNDIWEFAGSSQAFGRFTRRIIVSNVFRDGGGNIISSGGTLDLFTKRVESLITWNFAPGRNNEVSLKTYFTFWDESICEWTADDPSLNQVGSLNLSPNITATDIVVEEEGDAGYVTGAGSGGVGRFFTLNLTNPLNPIEAGSLALSKAGNGVDVSEGFAYLATADTTKELIVVNVSNLSSPTEAGFSGSPGGAGLSVAVGEGFVYLGVDKSSGPEFYIYNISNPTSPTVAGTFEVGKGVSAISLAGNRAYLAVTESGQGEPNLLILDVGNPANPTLLGSYEAPDAPQGAKGEGTLYVGGILHLVLSGAAAADKANYYLLDVSNPANVTTVGRMLNTQGINSILDVDAGSGFALLGTNKNGYQILIVDIRNPANPTEILHYDLGPGVDGLGAEIKGCYAYVASRDNNQEIKVVAPQQ
ncbi:MAG: hypothetical protein WEC39_00630, partial [Patescibacteria group bacterium]